MTGSAAEPSTRFIAVAALAISAAVLAGSGDVSYTTSDPRGTLLTSQAILEHGTFALDAYRDALSGYRVITRNGHRFYAYPPGTPIAALPAVAIARAAGMDMARAEDDDKMQRTLAAISVGLTAVLASLLALRSLPWLLAVSLAGIFVLATPVISTLGTALWSSNGTVLATLAALVLLPKDGAALRPGRAAGIGALLGFACWCRPTAIALAGIVMLWLWARAAARPAHQRHHALVPAVALSATVAVSLGLLVIMSWLTYGTWLPDYYIGMRLGASDRFGTAMKAHLVSPSRGLLIYAPAVMLAFAAALRWPRRVLRVPLAALGLAWICLHLVIVSRFPYWWGGYGYGSRLLVDVLPGVFALSCAAASTALDCGRRWRAAALLALIAAGGAGIWINSVQGLFNRATAVWNAAPNIDGFPGYAFDWQLPQFRATRARLADRLRRHNRWLRPSLGPDVDYTARSRRLQFDGWSDAEGIEGHAFRRSIDRTASVKFLVGEALVRRAEGMMLTLALGGERPLSGQVWFNGRWLADVAIRGREPEYFVIFVPRALVRTVEYDVYETNVLELRGQQGQEAPLLFRSLRVHTARRGS